MWAPLEAVKAAFQMIDEIYGDLACTSSAWADVSVSRWVVTQHAGVRSGRGCGGICVLGE